MSNPRPRSYGNSRVILDHTVLPATRQSWHSRPYTSLSWYSIKRPRRDGRLSWPRNCSKAQPVHKAALAVAIKTTVRSEIRTWVLTHRRRTREPLEHCGISISSAMTCVQHTDTQTQVHRPRYERHVGRKMPHVRTACGWCDPTRRSSSWRISQSINQSVIHSCIITVVQVIKSLQDPLEVGNN